MENERRQVMDQRRQGKKNVVRNKKWLRDRELRIMTLVSTCPPDPSTDGLEGWGN